jgi:hypothetical protein
MTATTTPVTQAPSKHPSPAAVGLYATWAENAPQ